jgi:hypothetical protein
VPQVSLLRPGITMPPIQNVGWETKNPDRPLITDHWPLSLTPSLHYLWVRICRIPLIFRIRPMLHFDPYSGFPSDVGRSESLAYTRSTLQIFDRF